MSDSDINTNANANTDTQVIEEIRLDGELQGPVVEIERKRESIAGILALLMGVIFILTIFLPIIYYFFNKSLPEELINYIKYLLPIETSLLGTAFGFYFSEKRHGK